jgi:hypothetical protein
VFFFIIIIIIIIIMVLLYLLGIFRELFTNFRQIWFVLEFLFDHKTLNAMQIQVYCVNGISLHSIIVPFECPHAGIE